MDARRISKILLFCGIVVIFLVVVIDGKAKSVNEYAFAQSIFWNTVTESTKIENLHVLVSHLAMRWLFEHCPARLPQYKSFRLAVQRPRKSDYRIVLARPH